MNENDALNIFKESKALLEGHFLLTSGLHSDRYIQCALALQYPDKAEKLCRGLAEKLGNLKIDAVVGPALGGVVVAQEVGRVLKTRAIFTERQDGAMTLRRGFSIASNEKVLVVEDVTTTGGSVKEVMDVVKRAGGTVVAVAALVDRSGGAIKFGVPYFAIITLDIKTYQPSGCPLCKAGIPALKPGSRKTSP